MPMKTGTYDIASLLAVANQSAAAYGEDRIAEVLQRDLAAHNRIVREDFMADLVEVTDDRQRIAGISTDGTMMEVDERGRAPTQKQDAPPSLGFPLRLYQWPIGWTKKYLEVATPRDLAIQQIGARRAHLRALLREAKKAFYLTTNYTFIDKLIDRVSLSVKRLANADGFEIPSGPNNETFDAATHTHYIAEAALSASGLTTAVGTVLEHGTAGRVIVAINSAQETAVRALTGFIAAADRRLILMATTDRPAERLDPMNPNDRLIGYFGAAEVWVKPWTIANYIVVYRVGAERKPLVMRQRAGEALQGLRVAGEIDAHPLRAEYQEAEFGFAVQDRVAMAVYQINNGTYQDPTITG